MGLSRTTSSCGQTHKIGDTGRIFGGKENGPCIAEPSSTLILQPAGMASRGIDIDMSSSSFARVTSLLVSVSTSSGLRNDSIGALDIHTS